MNDRDQELRRQAVDRAYRDHADDVYRVALAILREPDAAVDATHDTFVRAFERWHQYDGSRPLGGWLHGIVSHAALDQLRRQRVRSLAMPRIGQGLQTSVGPSDVLADPAIGISQRDLIEGALEGLKGDARAALVLRHYYGYDYAEIAGFLQTSPGNVGSILSRAHEALRERLTSETRDVMADRAVERHAAR